MCIAEMHCPHEGLQSDSELSNLVSYIQPLLSDIASLCK